MLFSFWLKLTGSNYINIFNFKRLAPKRLEKKIEKSLKWLWKCWKKIIHAIFIFQCGNV